MHAVEERLALWVCGSPSVELFLPLSVRLGAALTQLAGVGYYLVGDLESLFWIEAQNFLGGGNLFITQRSAVHAAGVQFVWCRITDDGLDADERWALGFLAGGLCSGFECYDVFTGLDGLDVPAVGLVARYDVLVEGDVRIVLDGDAVVIPEDDEVAQLLGARQRGSLGGNAFL